MADTGDVNAASAASLRESSSPLGRAHGLSDAELEICGEFFARATQEAGMDGALVFERLKQGASLADAMSLPPRAIETLYARARQWIAVGRFDKAERLFRALVLLQSESADYWIGYGACLKQAGRRAEAAHAFSAASAIRPDWAIPHFHLLGLAIHAGDWAGARRELAAFDAAASSDIPAAIVAEAARIRAALATRGDAPASP
jgi:Flp pilus assembly protein TadD